MAYEVGSAYLSVMPSTKGFASTLGRELDGPFQRAGRSGGETMGRGVERGGRTGFAAAGGALGKVFIGAFAAIGIGNIIGDAIGWVTDAINSAGELEQSVGGVDAVFKDNAQTIHDWAEGAADAVGLSKNEYNELATVIGAQLKNMGIPLDEATEKTGWLVEMGSDLAAQFGGSTSDAVSALSSLLRGERDPIERYGVSINQAAIEAEKAALGLDGLSGEADKNADLQATLSILTRQTADATGAFARESETATGQQQRLKAELENVKTEIGTALLPIVTDLAGVFADDMVPIIKEFAGWITENKDEIKAFAMFLVDMGLAGLEATLRMAQGLAMWYDVGLTVFDNLTRVMLTFVENLLGAAEKAFGWVPNIGPKLTTAKEEFGKFKENATDSLDAARESADKITNALGAAADGVGDLRQSLKDIDGFRATVYINAQGNATRTFTDGSFQVQGGMRGRATGGPVTAGEPYVVGEYEPELFVPDRSGVIYNQAQLADMLSGSGSSRPGVTQHNSFYGLDPESAADAMVARLEVAMKR